MILERAESCDFSEIYGEMQKNFPWEELRNATDALTVFEDSAYTVYHLLENGVRVGFITLWTLGNFVFGEHFVIYEPYRNHGLGGRAIDAVTERFGRMILEAEEATTEIAARRLGFYRRHGFFVNARPYFQPSYHKGEPDVPLALLSYPEPLGETELDQMISLIYQTVYHRIYERTDRGGI